MTIEVVVEQDYESLSRRATDIIVEQLRAKPTSLICTTTGSTPTHAYQLLAERYAESPELFAKIRVIKLDEWCGLEMDDPASCESYLQHKLIHPLSIPSKRFISFASDPADPQAECRRIADDLEREGPIDLAIVGLGVNGHLGFNEPGEYTKDHAHVAELEEVTQQHSMLANSSLEDVRTTIRLGLTLGMADIIEARHVLLLVNGPHKAEPLRRMLDSAMVAEACAIARRQDFAVLVRPPAAEFTPIRLAMDLGPCGLLIPMVENEETMRVIQDAVYLKPRGRRRPGGPGNHWVANVNYETWKATVEDNLVILPQIESRIGLDHVAAIAAHPLTTAVAVGPYDLSADLGVCWNPEAEEFRDALQRIRDAARAAGKCMWMIGDGPQLVKQGYRFLCIAEPTTLLQANLGELNTAIRNGAETADQTVVGSCETNEKTT